VTYEQRDGAKGGKRNARLQRPPPSLKPSPRSAHPGITPEVIAAVRAHVEERCARSPHQRDAMCKRIATHLKMEEQALILTETRDELFEGFKTKHPTIKIGRTKFYEVRPCPCTLPCTCLASAPAHDPALLLPMILINPRMPTLPGAAVGAQGGLPRDMPVCIVREPQAVHGGAARARQGGAWAAGAVRRVRAGPASDASAHARPRRPPGRAGRGRGRANAQPTSARLPSRWT
jgi:hypothetical protein